jgi:hypothetical protein
MRDEKNGLSSVFRLGPCDLALEWDGNLLACIENAVMKFGEQSPPPVGSGVGIQVRLLRKPEVEEGICKVHANPPDQTPSPPNDT